MHLSCKCASEFAPEGQLRLQLAPFLRTSRRESARSCVTSQVHEAILWAIFAPAGHRLNVFLRRRAPADLSIACPKNGSRGCKVFLEEIRPQEANALPATPEEERRFLARRAQETEQRRALFNAETDAETT